jgi:hypothetical protein
LTISLVAFDICSASYAYRFIELCEPSLNEVTVKAALKPSAED